LELLPCTKLIFDQFELIFAFSKPLPKPNELFQETMKLQGSLLKKQVKQGMILKKIIF
jgi:hypothetical protein